MRNDSMKYINFCHYISWLTILLLISCAKATPTLLPTGDIDQSITLQVPTQFDSIQSACDWTGKHRIQPQAWVTIQVADGQYNWKNIECIVPEGDRVKILGNTSDPSKVVINVDNSHNGAGFIFYRGHTVFLIDGFTINGTYGWRKHCDWNDDSFAGGFMAVGSGAGVQIGRNVRINKMYYGVMADHNASISVPEGGLTVNEAGDVGIIARWNGSVDARNTTVTNSCHINAKDNLGFGYMAEIKGSLLVDGSTANGNNIAGFAVQNGGSAWAHDVKANNNAIGVYATELGSIEANQAQVSGGKAGFEAKSGGYILADGATAVSAEGSGFNATDNGLINLGSGATAKNNTNGFTQYNNARIYGGKKIGTGNKYALFVDGNQSK